ncbi:disulfide bond formation protein DsbA [Novosphingobium sp. Fuku2-ISO-50]|nr:disulfide bond formation protein DsbA [Novosphingobium sp. Fuku2-ISO-50]
MVKPMTRPLIEFLFDFGSPNAYLVWKVLPDLARRHDADLRVVPCLLGGLFKLTGNQGPMLAFAGVKGKLAYDRLEMQRFIARHGLTRFAMNPHFPVNTLLMMRGLVVARHMGVEAAYIEAGLAAMWEDGRKMDDPAVFVATLDAAGLNGAAILAATQDPDVKAELAAQTETAAARGAFGIPTLFVDGEIYFGKERLSQIEEQLAG